MSAMSQLRWLTIGVGIACFLWLSTEDTSSVLVTMLGIGMAFSVVWRWLLKLPPHRLSASMGLVTGALAGSLLGVGSAVAITLLMFVKTAWHSHEFPDFPALMMLAMLERAPWWGLAGAFQGLAIMLVWQPTRPAAAAQSPSHPAIADTPSQSRPD